MLGFKMEIIRLHTINVININTDTLFNSIFFHLMYCLLAVRYDTLPQRL